jgi:hypothetical protein
VHKQGVPPGELGVGLDMIDVYAGNWERSSIGEDLFSITLVEGIASSLI